MLLLAFLAGVAPIQFLIHFADTQLSKLNRGWKRRTTAGARSVIELEGINSITAERLSEEGVDYVQQMALCNTSELSSKTKFPLNLIGYWKHQAILYELTADVVVGYNDSKKEYLADILDKRLGIRTISGFLKVWRDDSKMEQEALFRALNLLNKDNVNIEQLHLLFRNIADQGTMMNESTITDYYEMPSRLHDTQEIRK